MADSLLLTTLENAQAVTVVAATDPDASPEPLRYRIAGGADAALFQIDALSGQLRFVAVPDFEQPTDSDTDNRYEVRVEASDGLLTASQQITVRVIGADEAPQWLSNVLRVQNGKPSLDLRASDADTPATALVYTVSAEVGGWFALASSPETPLASFTQAQVDAGEVVFRLDGSGRLPGYALSLSDGVNSTAATAPLLSVVGAIPISGLPTSNLSAVTESDRRATINAGADERTGVAAPTPAPEAVLQSAPPGAGTAAIDALLSERAAQDASPFRSAVGPSGPAVLNAGRAGWTPGPTGQLEASAWAGGGPDARLSATGLDLDLRTLWRSSTALDLGDVSSRSNLTQALDRMKEELAGEDPEATLVIGSTALLSGGLSVGYVLWLLRGGVLVATVMSSVPAWAGIDPLPILSQARGDDDEDPDDEADAVERLFGRARRWLARPEAPPLRAVAAAETRVQEIEA